MVRAWFLAAVAFFAIVAGGCKVRERVTSESDTRTEAVRRVVQDSIAKRTTARIEVRGDTLSHTETVTEYAPPVVLNGKVYTPVHKKTVRQTDAGSSEKIDETETQDTAAQVTEQETSRAKNTTATATKRETDNKSGWYLTLIALGALAITLYFLGKRIDKYL